MTNSEILINVYKKAKNNGYECRWSDLEFALECSNISILELSQSFFGWWINKWGKKAGFLRNKLIINEADFVLALWDGKSKGTKHSIDLAIEKGIPIDIYIRN